jgi:hypothetical protein
MKKQEYFYCFCDGIRLAAELKMAAGEAKSPIYERFRPPGHTSGF